MKRNANADAKHATMNACDLAVSFQVIGHVKTCLVFFFGWVIFAAPITSRNVLGCALAVVGMIYYSHAVTKPAPAMTPSGSQNGIASGKA